MPESNGNRWLMKKIVSFCVAILFISSVSFAEITEPLKKVYLKLDNKTLATFDEVADDPFLILRTKTSKEVDMDVAKSWEEFSRINIFKSGQLVSKKITKASDREEKSAASIQISNIESVFDHAIPTFTLKNGEIFQKIWWQISADDSFEHIIPNFEGIQNSTETVFLDLLTDTFFSNGEKYYFRVKGLQDNLWTEWSEIYSFKVIKPKQIENIVFKRIKNYHFSITWDKSDEEGMIYHVFASHSLDFIPSLYYDKQINRIKECKILEYAPNDNLILSTRDNKIEIDDQYPFYRIVAENRGRTSIPSPIIYVYDNRLSIPRDILQKDGDDAERKPFPPAYSVEHYHSLKRFNLEKKFTCYNQDLRKCEFSYAKHGNITDDMWLRASPHFLPENHPVKPFLDRLCSSSRIVHNSASLLKAGFDQINPRRYSGCIVTPHRKMKGYMFKLHYDHQTEQGDWNLIMRARGASFLQEAIDHYQLGATFGVARKWLYPLPLEPSPLESKHRKFFILIAEAIPLVSDKDNKKMWTNDTITTRERLKGYYRLLKDQGMNDSVYMFNVPYAKDGRVFFIDTEHHHNQPIRFDKVPSYLSPQGKIWWNDIVVSDGG